MSLRPVKHYSSAAIWSKRLAFLALQLLIITLILHRFFSLYTLAAIYLFVAVFILAGLALVLALWGSVKIWRDGYAGTGRVILAFLVCFIIFAYPLWHIPKYFALPVLNDVTTDTSAPPIFRILGERRQSGANSTLYPGIQFAAAQADSFPDIGPLILERSNKEAYELVNDVVKNLGWSVINRIRPRSDGAPGLIEATDKTLLVGFVDDISIRISGNDASTRIDIRSASRFGKHDFGRNAKRIRGFLGAVKASLAKGEMLAQIRERAEKAKAEKIRLQEKEDRRNARAPSRSNAANERARKARRRSLRRDRFRDIHSGQSFR